MSKSTYTQSYSNFIGVDMSSDARIVSRNRLAYAVNMWRDYESEQGAAIETIPGFRRLIHFQSEDMLSWYPKIDNIWFFKQLKNQYLIVSVFGKIIYINVDNLKDYTTNITIYDDDCYMQGEYDVSEKSIGIQINNLFYIFDRSGISVVREEYSEERKEYYLIAERITGTKAYIPTTYYNNKPYEQRNAFSKYVCEIHVGDGKETTYLNDPSDEDTVVDVIAFKINDNIIGSEITSPSTAISSIKVLGKQYSLAQMKEISDNDVSETRWCFSTDDDGKYQNEYIVTESTMDEDSQGQDGPPLFNSREFIIPKDKVYDGSTPLKVEIVYEVKPTHFNTIGDLVHFQNDKTTMAKAILRCSKIAIYDGRLFLTGNPELPNTVFYSHRNLTGANDPTYFGVYNYFNDGDGNTPNVELLAMPNMLIVMKQDTIQDGSVYYHVGSDNPHSDESVRNLVPRIYPASKGAAGLGSAADTTPCVTTCNFLDDPVFLSKRGIEAIGKEDIRLERSMVHRSSNIDRLLRSEDLAHASIAEWKGYLVVCCNGHIYLADSRTMTQHSDGSYQYEWFYLEGVGSYENYFTAYKKMTFYPYVDKNFEQGCKDKGIGLWDEDDGVLLYGDNVMKTMVDDTLVYYFEESGIKKLIDVANQNIGQGFSGAKRVLVIGDRLFFATDYDICLFNTDKRGKNIEDEEGNIIREVDVDKIDYSWYTFGGVAYKSACAIRLDDCDKKALTKTTVYGTTVARLKMMTGSKCRIKSSINGRDWEEIAEIYNTRNDFADMRFDNVSFTENEDNVMVIPEVSRGWVNKQYYFESDRAFEPFGLYELSYIYKIAGKIRYV